MALRLEESAPPVDPVKKSWLEGHTLDLYVGGGSFQREQTSCSGPTHIYRHRTFQAGVGIGKESAPAVGPRRSWQLRLGVFGDVWSDNPNQGVDFMGTFGGVFQLDWRYVGLGVGATLGLGVAESPDPRNLAIDKVGFLLPGFYLRLGPDAFGLELGTAARNRIATGAFVGLRSAFWGHEVRLGAETEYWQAPVRSIHVYGDLRLRLNADYALQLHFAGATNQGGASGTAALSITF